MKQITPVYTKYYEYAGKAYYISEEANYLSRAYTNEIVDVIDNLAIDARDIMFLLGGFYTPRTISRMRIS